MPLHKKNPDVGNKDTVYSDTILIEQADAASFADNEEVGCQLWSFLICAMLTSLFLIQLTLMDWGNAIVRQIARSPTSGKVTSITMDLHLAGDFKSTSKKITWLSKSTPSHPLVPVSLLNYDYLITKRKLEKDDKVADVANRNTEFVVPALADANVLSKLKKGDTMQFERKGYFILDRIVDVEGGDGGKKLEFISIPDGRAAGLALKAGATSTSMVGTTAKKEVEDAADAVKMYKVEPFNSSARIDVPTSMYKVKSVYDV